MNYICVIKFELITALVSERISLLHQSPVIVSLLYSLLSYSDCYLSFFNQLIKYEHLRFKFKF
jgi:hypothetical protein